MMNIFYSPLTIYIFFIFIQMLTTSDSVPVGMRGIPYCSPFYLFLPMFQIVCLIIFFEVGFVSPIIGRHYFIFIYDLFII
jgi:hypothetical protein